MDDRERHEKGMARRRKVLGNAWVDRANANRTPFNEEFQDFITRYAWGEIWSRPHFDERTRRVLVIGTMIALGQWDEFRMHVRAAMTEGGFSADDIKEIILQQAIYCGLPAANHAFKEAAEVMKEIGKAGCVAMQSSCPGLSRPSRQGSSAYLIEMPATSPGMTRSEFLAASLSYPLLPARNSCGVIPVCPRKKRAKCEGSEKDRS